MSLAVTVQLPVWKSDGTGNYGPGYAFFTVTRHNFISAGISWFEKWSNVDNIPASHAFLCTGPDSSVEAFAKGVGVGTLSAYLYDPDVALLVRKPRFWTPAMGGRIVLEAEKHIGRGYDFKLIGAMAATNSFLGHAIDLLSGGRFSRWLNGLAQSKARDICSEGVDEVYQAMPELAGRGILKDPAYEVKPVDLLDDDEIFEPGAVELVRSLADVQTPFS